MISKRTVAAIKSLTDAVPDELAKNEMNIHLDAFEESDIGKDVYMSAFVWGFGSSNKSATVKVTVPTGEIAKEVLTWWRGQVAGLRVNKFEDFETDSSNPHRTYTMNFRDAANTSIIEIETYFADGTCSFVEQDTGEIEEVPERPAEAAYSRKIIKRVLVCEDQVIPTGLPESATALEA